MTSYSYRRWSIGCISVILGVALLTVALNFLFDPLWCFNWINRFNRYSVLIDARQQKTNLATFGHGAYDALLIGSSRVDSINPHQLQGYKAFNYAISAIGPGEYRQYIEYIRNRNRLRKIFIGLDFFSTTNRGTFQPTDFFARANEKQYRLRLLFSLDALGKLFRNYLFEKQIVRYDRKFNVLVPYNLTPEDRHTLFMNRFDKLKQFYSGGVYVYNDKTRQIYREIIDANKDVELVVFTTPESQALFESMVRQGRFRDYCRWLTDMVETFGGIHHFMYLNSVTTDRNNYLDADHFRPEIGTMIAHRLAGVEDRAIPADFGVFLTRENLAGHLRVLAQQAEEIKKRPGNQ
jgi:hypothetical protein